MIPDKLQRSGRTLYTTHTRPNKYGLRTTECNQFYISVQPDYSGGITEQDAEELAAEIQRRYNAYDEMKAFIEDCIDL